ncbi:8062_t:CDS:1, partial [Gigaspora rosea]
NLLLVLESFLRYNLTLLFVEKHVKICIVSENRQAIVLIGHPSLLNFAEIRCLYQSTIVDRNYEDLITVMTQD